jgi:hypothetical protein
MGLPKFALDAGSRKGFVPADTFEEPLLCVLGDVDVLGAEIVMRALPSLQIGVDLGGTGGRVVLACCVRGRSFDRLALWLDFGRLSACNDHEEAFLPGLHRSY